MLKVRRGVVSCLSYGTYWFWTCTEHCPMSSRVVFIFFSYQGTLPPQLALQPTHWGASLSFPRLLRLHPLDWLMFYLGYLPSDKQSKHWDWCDQRTCLHIFKTFEVVITLLKGCSYGRLLEPQKIGALYPWMADGRLKLTSGSSCQTPRLFLVDESCSQQLDGVTVPYTLHCWAEPLCLHLWACQCLAFPLMYMYENIICPLLIIINIC